MQDERQERLQMVLEQAMTPLLDKLNKIEERLYRLEACCCVEKRSEDAQRCKDKEQ
ncbi:hypothetical protein JOD43_000475 [Pullulanibacillus pueri]|uniref:Uncharacterized protein n=1 Tax=Pullulanibacillus pueri TaxID=1437324 RepID=A0A8J3ELA8_9BACL|nr:hypothetical protein [Pullulanibacillus pueri]MBM7680316.1 hypothetical protein [Pullulanibacillus pueri]GGH75690.1 hypothetical protein GCM10007096_05180 [Pullulanibacillus pueri]